MSKLADGWKLLKAGTLWAAYAKANPREAQRLDDYVAAVVAGGSAVPLPAVSTTTGRGLLEIVSGYAR